MLALAYQWGIVGAGKDYSGLEWILVQLRDVSESSRVTSKIAAKRSLMAGTPLWSVDR